MAVQLGKESDLSYVSHNLVSFLYSNTLVILQNPRIKQLMTQALGTSSFRERLVHEGFSGEVIHGLKEREKH